MKEKFEEFKKFATQEYKGVPYWVIGLVILALPFVILGDGLFNKKQYR